MKPESIKRLNFEFLLGALLILILSGAIAQEAGVRIEARRLFLVPGLCILLLMGIWRLVSEKKLLIMGGIIAGVGVLSVMIDFFLEIPGLEFVNMGILFMFILASTWIAFKNLLLSSAIDVNKIIGAICIYLLLGLNWAMFYLFINMAIPDSFHGLSSTDIGTQLPELMYYSFITLTTVGYGDLIPVKPLARTVAFLEGFVGQFYVAVLVAWLVGMFLSSKGQNHKQP